MDEDLKAYLKEMERELCAHTEAVETRLLREFWTWAREADARYRQHHSAVTGLDERVMLVEDRYRGTPEALAGRHRFRDSTSLSSADSASG